MSTILDLAIAISVADHASNIVKGIIGQFGFLQNATEETKKKLDGFKNMAFIGAGIAAAGAVGVAGLTHLAEKAADVQQQMIQLGGVYGLNIDDSQLKEIEIRAQALSQQTLFSKKEVLGIDVELAHAGISKELLTKVLPEATYLAEAEVGIGKSGSANRTAYNFARMADDAGIIGDTERMARFADDINRVINVTHASTESIGEAFKMSMNTVKGLGWTEQDNLLATAMAARSGMEGTMSGTGVKDFVERVNPFKYLDTRGGQKQLDAMNEMGLLEGVQYKKGKAGKMEIVGFGSADLLKDKDHLKSYADMVDVLSEKYQQFMKKGGGGQEYLADMTEEQLNKLQEKAQAMTGQKMSGGALQWAAMANHLWGEQGQNFAIISSHKEVFDKLEGQLKMQKDLHDQINVIRDSYKGQMHVFESNIETLGLQIGKPIMEAMIPVIKVLAESFGHLIEVVNNNPQVAKFLSLFAGAASALMLVGGAVLMGVAAFGTLSLALEAAEISMGTVALISGGVVLAIAAIAGAVYLIYKNWDSIAPYAQAVWSSVKESASATWEWFKSNIGPAATAVWHTIESTFGGIGPFFSKHKDEILSFLGFTKEAGKMIGLQYIEGGIKFEMPAWLKLLLGGLILDKAVGTATGFIGTLTRIGSAAKGLFSLVNISSFLGVLKTVGGGMASLFSRIPGMAGLKAIMQIAETAFGGLSLVIQKALPFVGSFMRGLFQIDIIKTFASTVGQFGLRLVTLGSQALIAAGRMAAAWLIGLGPVGWIILGVSALVAAGVAAWNSNFMGFRDKVTAVWDWVKTHAAAAWEGIKNSVGAVMDWFASLPEQALQWGSNLIQSFVDGIEAKLSIIPDALKNAAQTIAQWLHVASPTEKGPLSTNHLWGGNLIKSIAGGMLNNLPVLEHASAAVAGVMSVKGAGGSNSGLQGVAPSGRGMVLNGPLIGNITINQQPGEDARALAEQVADVVEMRLGFRAEQANLTLGRVSFAGVR